MNCGGTNYSDNVIKRFQKLVWISLEMNRLNQILLIGTNLIWDEANNWYFEALVELEKLKKDINIESTGKFVYIE